MKTVIHLSTFALLLALAGTVAIGGFTGGCKPTSTSDRPGQYVDDSVITTKVRSAYLADDIVKSLQIKVETVKGVVLLSGIVDNPDQKSAAGKGATAVAGVTDVKDNLIVK